MLRSIFSFIFVLFISTVFSADRYWISSSSSNWNNTSNWSTSSGGAGGASVPGSSDIVYFDANGTGNCTLDMDATVSAMVMSAGTLNTSTYNFTINGSGNSTFSGGTINGNNTFNIHPSGTALVTFSGTTFNPDVNVISPRILLNGSTFNSTSYFEKTGATNDRGTGGNTFVGNCTIKSSGSADFALGNGSNDSFSADLSLENAGSDGLYLSYNNSTTSIGGNLSVSNTGTATTTRLAYNGSSSSVSVSGNVTVSSNTTVNTNIVLGQNGSFSVSGSLTITNNGSANSTIYLANNTSSSATIGGAATITNSGGGTTKRIYLGSNGDVSFNSTLSITNSSSATNSQVYLNYDNNSSNTYSDNITVESTDADCDGVYFGYSEGSGTLAASKTITVGGSGFIAGDLYFRNFTQTASTAQSITTTGTSRIYSYDANWGGNIDFKAPRIVTRGTTFNGTCILEKSGSNNDYSSGGNVFKGELTLKNSGSGQFRFGNGGTDDFQSNVTINNSGSSSVYLVYSSPGTTTIAGTLDINNTSAASSGTVSIANDSISTLVVNGNTTVVNSGAGATKTVYLGNSGDITFNGTLKITNTSSATNSLVYCNNSANSFNHYNDNLIIEVDNADCDGVRFGNNNGRATLATGKTVSIGALGFNAGYLYFRNFTQSGSTSQTITTTSTSRIYNYDSDWGGNISFTAPRINTRGTTFNGTAYLEKNGSSNDYSVGGNTFKGNTTLVNSGSAYFAMGNGSSDDFQANLTINNTNSGMIYIANNSAGNQIAGNLEINNSGTSGSSNVYINNNAASTISIGGNCTINNNGSATTCNAYLCANGSLTLTGNLTVTNSASGTNENVYLSNVSTSSMTINGNTEITNSGTGSTSRVYVGNAGDIVFNGTLTIHNNSSSATSSVSCNYASSSENTYNDNIIVESSVASCDGVFFGNNGGTSTLANGKTITIGGAGFISGQLYLRNFTQTGSTAQSLTTTNDGILYSYDSDWGGNISFTSPSIRIRGTTFHGTADIEKNGSSNDNSAGGNTFNGNFTLTNSGSGYVRFGDGTADSFLGDVTLTNTGSNDISFARTGAGQSISGNLTINNTGTSTDVYIADQASATLSVGGNTTVVNSGGGTNHRVYLGNSGDVSFSGTIDISNSSNATNSAVYLNNSTDSHNTYAENITFENTNADSDGILFGDNGGSGELAASKTVSIKAGGFIAGKLVFENFTQNGSTAHSFTVTNTADLIVKDCNWGGDITLISPRMYVSGTTFHGNAIIKKTGADNDNSTGGNTFMGDVEFEDSGSGYLYLGSGYSSDFQANVSLKNSGSNNLIFARQGAGHSIAGDLSIENSGNGSQIYIADNTNSTLSIGGATSVINTSSGTNGRVYLGNHGDVTFSGDIDISNSSTATNSRVYIGNDINESDITLNGNLSVENTNSASDGIFINAHSATLAAAKTISIKTGGFSYGTFQFRNFTQTGSTAQSITLTGTALLYSYDSNWGGNVSFIAPRINTRGSTYNGTVTMEKNGNTDDASDGGNTFKENASFTNSSGYYFLLSNTNPDVFEKNLDIINSGTDEFFLGNNASGIHVQGDLTVVNNNNATNVYIANGASSSLTIDGATSLTNSSAATTSRIYFGNNGGVTANGNCVFTNESTGTNSYIYIAQGTNSAITITGDVSIYNKEANTEKRVYLGASGDITINGNLSISNTSTATNSEVQCNYNSSSNNTYNGNITLSCTTAGCDGIYFGNHSGTSTLTAGHTISVSGGFSEGNLYLENFTQSGSTAQSLSLTSNARLTLYSSDWSANASFTSPYIYLRSNTFGGVTTIEKTGSTNIGSYGDNTYNADVSIENSGSAYFRLANNAGNDYNSNVEFIRSSTADLRPAYNHTSTLAGNLSINTNDDFIIGNASTAYFEFDGTAAQSINNTGAANTIEIRRLRTNNSSDEITLNTPIRIVNNLDLSNGNIISSSTNYLRMNNDAVVDNVSDNAYVDGPVIKYGNDAFVFPVGGTDGYGDSHYAGIGISAPSATSDAFTAQYHASKHASAETFSDPLQKVSLVEYWDLDRTSGSSTIDVTLYWNNGTRSGIGNLSDLRVAHWTGTTWESKGEDATTGNASNGSITVNGISSFSPFTFGTVDNLTNVLPVSLLSFDVVKDGENALIKWTTASEHNNDYFIVERTQDFISTEEVGRVSGAGNSNSLLDYKEYDYSPLKGISYYRLVQFDFNGAKKYFNWKAIDFHRENLKELSIYPNPSNNGEINLTTVGFEGSSVLEILTADARIIYSKSVIINKLHPIIPIDVNVKSGVYFIRVINGNKAEVKKWIVN